MPCLYKITPSDFSLAISTSVLPPLLLQTSDLRPQSSVLSRLRTAHCALRTFPLHCALCSAHYPHLKS